MGFMELLGTVAGRAGGRGGLTDAIGELLDDGGGLGGLPGLLRGLADAGLGEQGASWVAGGRNLPISAEQLEAVLGGERVRAVAGKLGVTPEKAARQLARYLPQIVDRVTPDGAVPDAAALRDRLARLAGAAGSS